MPKVLITDDAIFMRLRLRGILVEGGYEVTAEAADGLEAIERYRSAKPDIVMMDITMPNMDGISAVREIIKIDPAARIVICSAMGRTNLISEAVAAGALDFIIKPFQPEQVLQTITRLFE